MSTPGRPEELDLNNIKVALSELTARRDRGDWLEGSAWGYMSHVPKLMAEVERLREERDGARLNALVAIGEQVAIYERETKWHALLKNERDHAREGARRWRALAVAEKALRLAGFDWTSALAEARSDARDGLRAIGIDPDAQEDS